MKPIFCGNFEYDARQNDLERLFRKYGKVDRVDMKSGFAFIYMEDERDAEDAIRGLDRMEFGRKGRRLRVEWTKQERGVRRPSGGSRRSAANMRPSKTLFVINFDPYHTRTRDLEKHFEPYGKIVNVRIRRNFAFVQYDSEDDATRALEATNLSKLMDRVISVEFAVKDDDDKRNGYSPERGRDRSPDRRGRDRGRSPSPYRRERASPDYGRGRSPSPYRRERGSPDYGRRRSLSPRRKDKVSPDYGRQHIRSRSPLRAEKTSPTNGRGTSSSPYRKERASLDKVRDPSPYRRKERSGSDHGRGPSNSPYGRERASPGRVQSPSHSPYGREQVSPDQGRQPSSSPYERENASDHDHAVSPDDSKRGLRQSPDSDGAESPSERFRSRSPAVREEGSLSS